MRLKWTLTLACIKMFFREKEAVFWTLFFPLFMIVLFGFVKFDRTPAIEIGIVSGNTDAALVEALKKINSVKVYAGTKEAELKALERGDRALLLEGEVPKLAAYLSEARPQEAQLAQLLVQQTLDRMTLNKAGVQSTILQTTSVQGVRHTYMDFLVPGVLSMSIMQMGIFSVAFVFVDLKKRGILKRLRVTPINPGDFITAQVITRLIVLVLQIIVMIAVGMFFFKLHFVGSIWDMFAVGVVGAVVFLGMGFALAGLSTSENQVAPLANVITMPQMLLSGIFFSRENLPGFAHVVTKFFPLTYLADGLRAVAIDGATLMDIWPQFGGLAVWAAITTIVAVRLFRWE